MYYKLIFILFTTLMGQSNCYSIETSSSIDFKNYMINTINTANETVDALIYKFDSEDIFNTFENLGERGVKFRFICDKNSYDFASNLKKYGSIKKFESEKYTKLHAKATLIDKKTLIIGSSNFDKTSLTSNLEILLVLNNNDTTNNFLNIFNNLWYSLL